MTMRPESNIFELREIASGVTIAASVREISDSSCRSDLRSVVAASCLLHASRALEHAAGSQVAMVCET